MKIKDAKKELKRMLDIERRMLLGLALDEGTEEEAKYVSQKLFDVVEYILTLQEYIERFKDED
tara:strand:+ start:2495 stop:2683 length:189 start_codon:yes stop_codon:yes gene_type:complete